MRLETLAFLTKETWTGTRRHPLMSLASTINVAVALTILAVGVLAIVNINHITDSLLEKGQIGVFLADDADRATVESRILADERVEETEFVPKAEGLRRMEAVYELPLTGLLSRNPIPDKIVVNLRRPEEISDVASEIRGLPGVEHVDYGSKYQDRIVATNSVLRVATLILGLLLVFGTFLIIQSTVRLTIHARRREIRIMQLVGATNWFVRVPFILEGMLYGIAGAAISAVTVLVAYFWVQDYIQRHLSFIAMVYGTGLFAITASALLIAGSLFGGVSSIVSIRRYLHEA